MRVKITKCWSIGLCIKCGNPCKVALFIQTSGLFKAYCNTCEDWQDFRVVAQDIEYEEPQEKLDVD